MQSLKYFWSSFALAAVGLVAAYLYKGPAAAVIVGVLMILETSLSFDNAVVNARVLAGMDEIWRRRFILWGMPIAVFGMRLVFPLLIVGLTASLDPISVLDMAINSPDLYASTLIGVHHQIAAFGGAFLMLVFLKFFLDASKDHHWVHVLEAPLAKFGKLESVQILLTTLAVLLTASFMDDAHHKLEFVTAGAWGVITYILADGIGAFLGDDAGEVGATVAKTGLAGFIYLELVDASFSFDGVIGAFALSHDLFIIAIGLGIGAMFVRSLTLLMVDRGTLTAYRFLEHGAFWGIGALAVLMFVSVHYEIPEVITGLIGATLIGLALYSSIRANRRDAIQPSA